MYDALVVGGSFAGLSAATYIARGRHSVAVVDAGLPRNRFSPAAHGFFGQDGVPPAEMLAAARRQLERYPEASVIADIARVIRGHDGAFEAELDSGKTVRARKLVVATGVVDLLPDVPGLAERWGKSVLHCPYCHGYEFAGRRLGVLAISPLSFHQAQMIPNWGPTTLLLNGLEVPDNDIRARLVDRAVHIEPGIVKRLYGDGGSLTGVELAEGRGVTLDALYVTPSVRQASPFAAEIGCDLDEGPSGEVIRVDATMRTSVPGIYAAGDCARWPSNAMLAAADGVMAGSAVSQALITGWTPAEVKEVV